MTNTEIFLNAWFALTDPKIFLIVWLAPAPFTLVMSLTATWFYNCRGQRELTLYDVLFFAGISVVPFLNALLAFIIFCVHANNWLNVLDRVVLITDRNREKK